MFYGIKFAGATRKQRKRINGISEKTEEIQNGKPVFIKVGGGSQNCCWYTARDRWLVSSLKQKDANNATGCTISIEQGLATPDLVATWNVVNDDRDWEEQPAVFVLSSNVPCRQTHLTVTGVSYTEVQAAKEA